MFSCDNAKHATTGLLNFAIPSWDEVLIMIIHNGKRPSKGSQTQVADRLGLRP